MDRFIDRYMEKSHLYAGIVRNLLKSNMGAPKSPVWDHMHNGFLVKPQELQKITSIVGVNVRDFQEPLQKWWVKQKNIEDTAVMGMIGYLWIFGGGPIMLWLFQGQYLGMP